MRADRMTYCTKKLQAIVGAAVEARQTRFNSLVVEHVRLFLRPTDVQAVAKARDVVQLVDRQLTAGDATETSTDLFNRAV